MAVSGVPTGSVSNGISGFNYIQEHGYEAQNVDQRSGIGSAIAGHAGGLAHGRQSQPLHNYLEATATWLPSATGTEVLSEWPRGETEHAGARQAMQAKASQYAMVYATNSSAGFVFR